MRVLVTVKTYPQPSVSYDELVCTAGFTEEGRWVRIYPVMRRHLDFVKYEWVELDLIRRHDRDFRPESYSPVEVDLNDLKKGPKVGTKQGWYQRKQLCLQNVYTSMDSLIEDSKEPKNVSLAVFKPARVKSFLNEPDDDEWKPEWLERMNQEDMFSPTKAGGRRAPIEKIPHRFKYRFEDDSGRESTMSILDWEIFELYRKCLAAAEGDEDVALEKVRQKYEAQFLNTKDLWLFLGTTLEHHQKRHSNPFTIVGVFYPPKRSDQAELL